MTILFPSDQWIKQLSTQLNASETYEKSALDWEGDFIFVVQADDAYPETAYLFLGLYHGKSTSAEALSGLDARKAEYIISAPFSTWRKVIEGKIDPIQGMMTRQLVLKGNLIMIMRYPKAAKEILACTQLIPTRFGV